MVTLMSSDTVKARKEHKCSYCGLKINKGDTYERSGLVFEGSAYTWKSHITCHRLASKLKWFDCCDEGLTGEDFRESVTCHYQIVMSEKFTEQYESKDFKYPSFEDQLKFLFICYDIS